MRGQPSLVVAASLALWLSVPSAARAQKESPAQAILRESNWTMTIAGAQHGALRIRNGTIYPGDTRLNQPVGEANFTPTGELSLRFLRHPKIAAGEALVAKVANGEWAGTLVQPAVERPLVLHRKR